jgi:hypothetical protein
MMTAVVASPASDLSNTGEFFAPASKMIPEINTPSALPTVIDAFPRVGISVGKPRPQPSSHLPALGRISSFSNSFTTNSTNPLIT